MTDLLFATPWWLPTAIIGVGVFLFITANKRQLPGPRNVGIGLVALAVVLILVSYFMETDKEKVTRETRELVRAVQDRDWTKMQSLLDSKANLAISSATIYANREDLVKGAQAAAEQYGLKSVVITSLEAEQTQTLITVTLAALSEQDFTLGRPIPSSWQFEWQQTGKDWALSRITCLRIANEQGPQVGTRFPK